MTTLLESLTLPLRLYEAATPFAIWLMAEGWLEENATLAIFSPIIWLGAECAFIARRQDGWIEAVLKLRACVYLIMGRKLS